MQDLRTFIFLSGQKKIEKNEQNYEICDKSTKTKLIEKAKKVSENDPNND